MQIIVLIHEICHLKRYIYAGNGKIGKISPEEGKI